MRVVNIAGEQFSPGVEQNNAHVEDVNRSHVT
jgi:hypothetical protein